MNGLLHTTVCELLGGGTVAHSETPRLRNTLDAIGVTGLVAGLAVLGFAGFAASAAGVISVFVPALMVISLAGFVVAPLGAIHLAYEATEMNSTLEVMTLAPLMAIPPYIVLHSVINGYFTVVPIVITTMIAVYVSVVAYEKVKYIAESK